MTARAAPYFPQSYTADGVLTRFLIPFGILDAAHLRVIVNGVLKVLGTDYVVQNSSPVSPTIYTSHIPGADSSKMAVNFLSGHIPTNGQVIKLLRNTPIARADKTLEMGPDVALYAHYRQQERDDQLVILGGAIGGDFGQTALLASTALSFVAPCDGYVGDLDTLVTKAVTTGGTLTVAIDGVAVTGMVATIANSAAVGANQRVAPSSAQASYTVAKKGQTITVTPASFATAGDVRVALEFQPADLT